MYILPAFEVKGKQSPEVKTQQKLWEMGPGCFGRGAKGWFCKVFGAETHGENTSYLEAPGAKHLRFFQSEISESP